MNTAVTNRNPGQLKLGEDGSPIISTLQDRLDFAATLVQSGMLPKSYQNAQQVAGALAMASEVGLKAGISTLRRTAVINGTPSFYAEMPLAIVQASGQLEDFEGYHFDKAFKKICIENKNVNQPVYGYYFKAKRVGMNTPLEDTYTLDQAAKAGLGNVWNKHPEDMLKWRTIGKVLKVLFADIFSGKSIAEFDFNTMPTSEDGGNVQSNIEVVAHETSELNEIVDAETVEAGKVELVNDKEIENAAKRAVKAVNKIKDESKKEEIVDVESKPIEKETPKEAVTQALSDGEREMALLCAYKIPIGAMTGKTISEIKLDDLKAMEPKIAAYTQKEPAPSDIKEAKEMLQNIRRFIELATMGTDF